ncbi:MAG: metalloregulator ArsR/SmtB family transcription factor, partial [Planctomycetota bacterium]
MPDEDEYRSYQQSLYEQFARVGKAVDSPRRVELLELLSQAERTVQKLAELTDMSVANTSRHLRILLQARLVEKEKKGVYAWYRLADDSVYEFFHALRNVAESRLAEVQRITAEL